MGLYTGDLEEIKDNEFEISVFDGKRKIRAMSIFLNIYHTKDRIEVGWKKRNFWGKMVTMHRVEVMNIMENYVRLLKGLVVMIAQYCCLYKEVEKDVVIDGLISFVVESVLMDEARGILVGLEGVGKKVA